MEYYLALINTEKGEKIIENIKHNIDFINVTSENYMLHNLRQHFLERKNKEVFWKDYEENDFKCIMKNYAKY